MTMYLVYEFIPYEGMDRILHVFSAEEEAIKAVEYYREKYKVEYGNYEPVRFQYVIHDLEEEFKPGYSP